MTTLNDLRQRIENEYLEPVIEETPSTTLEVTMSDIATSFTIATGVFSPDEESYIVAGRPLEIDNELVRVTSYNQGTGVIECKRAIRGSAAVEHDKDTAEVRIPTRWPRATVVTALRAAIDGLWRPLFAVQTEQATVDTTRYIELPASTITVVNVEVEDRYGDWQPIPSRFLPKHPLDPSVAAVQVARSTLGNRLCLITYGTKIVAPTDADDTIVDLPTNYERILIADAAANLLAGVDVDAQTQERLTEQIKLEGFPVRSGASISQNLIRYHEYLVGRADQDLVSQYPRGVERRRVTLWRT